MDEPQCTQGELFALAFKIGHLARDELAAPGGLGEFAQKRGDGIARGALRGGEDFKRDGEQGVPGKHGDPLAKDLVAGGATPAQIVVVHAREVVVDERVGVDAFHGAGGGQGRFQRAAAGLGCRKAEDGPQPFAARKERVAHGLVHGGGFDGGFGEESVERPIYQGAAVSEVVLQNHGEKRIRKSEERKSGMEEFRGSGTQERKEQNAE